MAVSLNGGVRYVYAKNGSDEYVLVGSGNSESGVFLNEMSPTVAGVGIVCRGGGDPSTRLRLIELVSAALGVGTNKIYITEAQK